MKKLLITGGYGFLGRNICRHFKAKGYSVYGVGFGGVSETEFCEFDYDHWQEGSVTFEMLCNLDYQPDIVVHCGGGSSVFFSETEPRSDFVKTVSSTSEILEYLRLKSPRSKLIYPSSPAVIGSHGAGLIKVSDKMNPVSSYGWHKKIAENLCQQYSNRYGLDVAIIRFFSIYGNGLRKQLLWDACQKLSSGKSMAEFWGTGEETRDFIHINDAVKLVEAVADNSKRNLLVNGATGKSETIRRVLGMLKEFLSSNVKICFNSKNRLGDPIHYQADISDLSLLPWKPNVSLEVGLKHYADWYRGETAL
jgi:UDP-glucose 4-epimerase